MKAAEFARCSSALEVDAASGTSAPPRREALLCLLKLAQECFLALVSVNTAGTTGLFYYSIEQQRLWNVNQRFVV